MFKSGLLITAVAAAIVCNGRSAAAAQSWSACLLVQSASGAPVVRIEVQAATSCCSLWFMSANSAAYAAETDKRNLALLASNPMVAGLYNGSLGRPPAVRLMDATASNSSKQSALVIDQGKPPIMAFGRAHPVCFLLPVTASLLAVNCLDPSANQPEDFQPPMSMISIKISMYNGTLGRHVLRQVY
jgi:hypothetical protein